MQGVLTATRSQPRELRAPFPFDVGIVALTALLVLFGLVMIYSTTAIASADRYGDGLYYVKRQLVGIGVGIVLLLVAQRLDLGWLQRLSPAFFFLAVALLLLPLIPGLGHRAGGASRWISLGFFNWQPSEFAKVLMVLFLAGYLSRHESRVGDFWSGIVKPFCFVGVAGALLLLQPDMGTTVVLFLVTLIMVLAAGAKLRHLALCGAGLLGLFCALVVTSPYRLKRVTAFLDPWSDAAGKGYQLIQSLIAVGTGHVTGVGVGESQQKLFFLPAAHTDFIFAVIAEEWGFIGAVAVLALFLLFLWRGVRSSHLVVEDTFAFTLGLGMTLLIVLPALLNIGVVTGLLPTKGMVLPLLGYGGSSIMSSLLVIGLLLAVSRAFYRRHL